MTPDRWIDIQGLVKEKFPVIASGQEKLEDGPGQLEFIEFEGPLGMMRCEFITKPKITDTRGIGGHAVGRMQHQYSPTEHTTSFHVYKIVGGDWEEIDKSVFS